VWNSKPVISIFGSSQIIDGDEEYRQARLLGRLLAREGFVVCTGGYGGTMEAICRGATEMKGAAIGLTLEVFGDREANPFVTREIRNATLFERLANFTQLSEGFIALRGGVGTLGELSVVWNLMQTHAMASKPFVLLGEFWPKLLADLRRYMRIREKDIKLLHTVATPEEAVEVIKNHLKS
jgi:uncharacterized protein (TIGR00730 family)